MTTRGAISLPDGFTALFGPMIPDQRLFGKAREVVEAVRRNFGSGFGCERGKVLVPNCGFVL